MDDPATASYAQHLADAYQLTLPQLLDGTNITLHRHGTSPTAELRLNHIAARHLAPLARIPLPHMTHALTRLTLNDTPSDTDAAARWKQLETEQQPARACTLCTRHPSHGATDNRLGFIRRRTDRCARATSKQPPTHGSPPPSTQEPCPNPPPHTTLTSPSCSTPAPPPPGPQRPPSPPTATTTSNTSPTAGTPA